ncbi:ras-related protein Rab-43-like [Mytilus californianus]|uniref:ras-related protein Rab-43-like n=1 Tax=Mytilus californianus TaxID=6549 RepID=UPI002245CE28|nr:ras-related protein Rab-43-like [Mytilus californianus]
MGDSYDYLFKIILVGDANVGKTSFVRRFTTGHFQRDCKATIGVDFTVQTLQLDGKIVKLQIWDTTGQERFRSLIKGYYRNAHAVLVMYDITDTESLKSCVRWMNDVRINSGEDIPQILLGNKCDKLSSRTVSSSDGERFARQHNMMSFLETSAKDGRNVDDAFYKLAQELYRTHSEPMDYRSDSIKLDFLPDNTASWWGCCGY